MASDTPEFEERETALRQANTGAVSGTLVAVLAATALIIAIPTVIMEKEFDSDPAKYVK